MLTVSDAQLNAWLIEFFWPLTRILGLFMIAPVFGHRSVPTRVKLALGVFTALIVSPTLPDLPQVPLTSWTGLFILVQQFLIGLAIGFVMRLVFAGVEAAGEVMGLQIGLGFATFFDASSAGQTLVIGRFLNILAVLVFLSIGAHLMLLALLVESFHALPVSATPLAAKGFFDIAGAGGAIFALGLQLALPLIAILLVVNLALGVLTRSAPQLNIFAIGFPITLGVGLIVLDLSLGQFAPIFRDAVDAGFVRIGTLIAAFGGAS
jgi:flagellar biosynthetic protein FliR